MSPASTARRERYLAIHLPAFRLERCGYDADEVAVLIAEVKSAMRIVAHTPAAFEAGLCQGMTVAQARSLVPEVQVDLLDPAEEARDRGELLRAFEPLSDQIVAFGDSDLVAEVSRTTRSHGGEPAVVARAVELAERLGHRVSVALTDDPHGALALALCTPEAREIVLPGEMASALGPLPVAALRASVELLTGLRALGIHALGELAQLDAASVADRFGPEGAALHRIASGIAAHTVDSPVAWVAETLPRVSAVLPGATTTLQLAFVLTGLLAQLSRALADRDLAAVRLRCTLILERTAPVTFGVRVGRPTRDVRTLERLVLRRLEGLTLKAPVEEWAIEVGEAVPEQGWQPGLTDRSEAGEPLPDVLARLTDALGDDAVYASVPVDRWRPEGAWAPIPFKPMPPLRRPLPPSDDVVALQERWERSLRAARPTQLLERPVAIEVRCAPAADPRAPAPEGFQTTVLRRPQRLLWETGWHTLEAVRGPECLSGDWWRPELAWDRVYWVVGFQGRSAWIFQSEGLWFLHGWF